MTDWHNNPDCNPCEKPASISIKLECANAAFDAYWNTEAGRILHELADKLIEGERIPEKVLDSNGNTVGSISIK